MTNTSYETSPPYANRPPPDDRLRMTRLEREINDQRLKRDVERRLARVAREMKDIDPDCGTTDD